MSNELNIELSCRCYATVDVWGIQDMMKELKLELQAIKLVRNSRRSKVNRTSRETIEGLIMTNKIVCPYFQQDRFPESTCNVIANGNTRRKMLHCQLQSSWFACTKKGHPTKDYKSKNKDASSAKVVIIQVHVKEIAVRHSQVVTELIQQVRMIQKRMKKVLQLKTEPKNDSQGKMPLVNTAVSSKRVVLMKVSNSKYHSNKWRRQLQQNKM